VHDEVRRAPRRHDRWHTRSAQFIVTIEAVDHRAAKTAADVASAACVRVVVHAAPADEREARARGAERRARPELAHALEGRDRRPDGSRLSEAGADRRRLLERRAGRSDAPHQRYAAAKEKIEQLARFKLAGATPAEQLLELTARVWVPGGRVGNDVANFGKGVHDALEKIVYRNDNQLRATHWLHAGVDVDAPRAEIILTPYDR
jgi:Holliday junction resolvase RusA-like endonuclease